MKHLTLLTLLAVAAPLSWGEEDTTYLCITNWKTINTPERAVSNAGGSADKYIVSASLRTFKVKEHGSQNGSRRWKLIVNNTRTIVGQGPATNSGAGMFETLVIHKSSQPSIEFIKTRLIPGLATSEVGTCTEL